MSTTSKKKKVKGKAKRLLGPLTFYFSDANLRKDRFITSTISQDPDGYFPIKLFLKFNKVKQVTSQVKDVLKALKHLDHLEVSADGLKVRRKNPEIAEKDVDGASIYVENIPEKFAHDDLEAIFSKYGAVDYISLPRWKNRKHKGFAFVEFASVADAEQCVSAFRASTKAVASIPMAAKCWRGPKLPTLERDKVMALAYEEQARQWEGGDGDAQGTVGKRDVDDGAQQMQQGPEEDGRDDSTSEVTTVNGDPGLGLRVIPKREWLDKKKEYKTLQRQYISTIKNAWREDNHYHYTSHGTPHTADDSAMHPRSHNPSQGDKAAKSVNRDQYRRGSGREKEAGSSSSMKTIHDDGTSRYEHSTCTVGHDGDDDDEEKKDSESAVFDPASIVHGVVVCIENVPLGISKQQLKAYLFRRSTIRPESIGYLDFVPAASFCHVRFVDATAAQVLVSSQPLADEDDLWGSTLFRTLSGKEEVAYWQKMHDTKIHKRNKRKQKRQRRGREKFLKSESHAPKVAPATVDTSFAELRTHAVAADGKEGVGEGSLSRSTGSGELPSDTRAGEEGCNASETAKPQRKRSKKGRSRKKKKQQATHVVFNDIDDDDEQDNSGKEKAPLPSDGAENTQSCDLDGDEHPAKKAKRAKS